MDNIENCSEKNIISYIKRTLTNNSISVFFVYKLLIFLCRKKFFKICYIIYVFARGNKIEKDITLVMVEEFKMTKAELIDSIAKETSYPKTQIDSVIKAFTKTVTDALANGQDVQLVGFGTFEVIKRAEREGINPQTKEKITIAASKAPKFNPGKALKDAVNK